jgi:ribosome-associated protein
MNAEEIKTVALNALDDLKAKDVVTLDVRGLTSVTDFMLVGTGTSNRHVKSLATNVSVELKKHGCKPLGIEGGQVADWMLVDAGDVVVHVMSPEARDFYDLERLWSVPVDGE